MNDPAAIKEPDVPGGTPTYEQVELIEWQEETRRKSLGVVSDSLRQLVTLAAAILGGTAALYGQIPVLPAVKALFSILLFGVLGLSLWGSYPITATTSCIEDIKRARDQGIARRSWFLWAAYVLLFVALLLWRGAF